MQKRAAEIMPLRHNCRRWKAITSHRDERRLPRVKDESSISPAVGGNGGSATGPDEGRSCNELGHQLAAGPIFSGVGVSVRVFREARHGGDGARA